MRFNADYYDGLSASAKAVSVELRADYLFVHQSGEEHAFSLADIQIQPRLGNTKRIIELPDGGRLESFDIGDLDKLHAKYSTSWVLNLVHYFENHLQWVLVALVLIIVLGWGLLKYGVPILAEQIARATPLSVEKSLGAQILKGMDFQYGYFKPSKLSENKKHEITEAVKQLCAKESCPDYVLEFRVGGAIGANAFALPGGIILVTDELVKLSVSDDELVAVIAHEMGHVYYRHALRQTMQGSLSGLILVMVTGDLNTIASGLPAVMLQMSYSREFESQADNYALNALHQACISPQVFADILQRLSKKTGADAEIEIISSHPDTLARIQPFLNPWHDCRN